MSASPPLIYFGSNFFRQRLLLSTLSGRNIKIIDIRSSSLPPGLSRSEASLLRLLDKLTDGSSISINESGTELFYSPGIIIGGGVSGAEGGGKTATGEDFGDATKLVVHDCGRERCLTYFLDFLVLLAPFAKGPVNVRLKGVTNVGRFQGDTSVDVFRTVTLPFLKNIGLVGGVVFKVLKRGTLPKGGGEVSFQCPILKRIVPFQMLEEGKVKRVRGVAYSAGVTRQLLTRMIDQARAMLNRLLPDVWIYHDMFKGKQAGKSRGYGVALVAESITGCLKGADMNVDVVGEKMENERKEVNEKRKKRMRKCEEIVEDEEKDDKRRRMMEGREGGENGQTEKKEEEAGNLSRSLKKGRRKTTEEKEGKYEEVHDVNVSAKKISVRANDEDEEENYYEDEEDGNNSDEDETKTEDHTDNGLMSSDEDDNREGHASVASSSSSASSSSLASSSSTKLTTCEIMGRLAASRLLLEIEKGGVVDTTHQYLPLFFMALAEEHQPCKVLLSRLTSHSVQWIRHLRDFFGVVFDFEEKEEGRVLVKCVGVNYTNVAKKTF